MNESELVELAKEYLKSQDTTSVSRIQRALRIGYVSAARILVTLKEQGYISEDWDVSRGGYVVLGK